MGNELYSVDDRLCVSDVDRIKMTWKETAFLQRLLGNINYAQVGVHKKQEKTLQSL